MFSKGKGLNEESKNCKVVRDRILEVNILICVASTGII